MVTAETMIALSAAVVFAAATTAVAMINYQANVSLAASAPNGTLTAAYGQNWPAGYDASSAAIFRAQLTRTCTPAMRQYSRC